MPDESNIERVRRGFEAFRRGDLAALEDFLHPDVKWHGGDPRAEGACINRAQALRFMRRRAPDRPFPELLEAVGAGDRVGVVLQLPAGAGESGPPTAALATLRDGRAIELVHYPEAHRALMVMAVERDAAGQRALLHGDLACARPCFEEAAGLYLRSWEYAPPRSYGRLVGAVKAAILAGGAAREAAVGRIEDALAEADRASPTAAYAAALAALSQGHEAEAAEHAGRMTSGGADAFARASAAIIALANHDQEAYTTALVSIVRDFEARSEHLTGVAIADTAVMLEQLASERGLAVRYESALLPRPEG